MFKKIFAMFLLLSFFIISVSAQTANEAKPQITSSAYLLYNPDNDEVVDSKNATQRMYPASLTKMLTALTVLDLCEDIENETVTVTENAITSLYGTGSSTANIKIGEKFTVKQLLYLMLLPSGNDAANALAEHFCGDSLAFSVEMNRKAKEIGMVDSNFVTPHGLHNDNHYSTALDLAVLADAYLSVPLLAKISSTVVYKVPKTNKQGERDIRTTNYMLIEKSGYDYEYATGLKTGNTDKAGRCLAASAKKGNIQYICILLDTPEAWNRYGLVRTDFLEACEFFKYAFDTYETVKIADKGLKVTELPVFETFDKTVTLGLESDVYATLPKNTDVSSVTVSFKPQNLIENKFSYSPVKKNDVFGKANLLLDGQIIGSCNVVALDTVEPHGLIVFWHKIDLYVYIALGVIAFLLLLFVTLIIRKKIVMYKRKKQKEKRLLHRKQLQEAFAKQEPYNYFKMD
ncbi:MAG: D-alanyl-D-alanine carboxypeptidase [Clostridia bacterium]|nr:D-alanyl-D-alanine carboxypeptidase [Clostridia bacterium]